MTASLLSLSLRDADLPLLREALEDAIEEREPPGYCWNCRGAAPGRCALHAANLIKADAYRELLERIGDER